MQNAIQFLDYFLYILPKVTAPIQHLPALPKLPVWFHQRFPPMRQPPKSANFSIRRCAPMLIVVGRQMLLQKTYVSLGFSFFNPFVYNGVNQCIMHNCSHSFSYSWIRKIFSENLTDLYVHFLFIWKKRFLFQYHTTMDI